MNVSCVNFSVNVDDREARSQTVEALRCMDGIELNIQRLPLGDYSWEGGLLLFERKTLKDLVASIKDGRLLGQACRLASESRRAVLILEGTACDLANSRMRREAIQGALISVTVILGIPLLRSKDPKETASLMLYAARQVCSPAGKRVPRLFNGRRPRGKRKIQLEVLQGIPGIGPARASWLLENFGSVESIVNANSHQLTQVSGIGWETARVIRWAVAEGHVPYGKCRPNVGKQSHDKNVLTLQALQSAPATVASQPLKPRMIVEGSGDDRLGAYSYARRVP